MNVRSAPPPTAATPAAADDLTARARIRDAAIGRFASDGFGVGLRAIAADAGVSPALVIHHFGSKDGLRAACDAHVHHVFRGEKSAALAGRLPADVVGDLARIGEYAPIFGYLVRSLLDGGPLAAAFVDGLVEDSAAFLADGVAAGTVQPSADPQGRARFLVTALVGNLVMARIDGAAGRGPDPATEPAAALETVLARVMPAGLELYTHGMFTDSSYLDAYTAYTSHTKESR